MKLSTKCVYILLYLVCYQFKLKKKIKKKYVSLRKKKNWKIPKYWIGGEFPKTDQWQSVLQTSLCYWQDEVRWDEGVVGR